MRTLIALAAARLDPKARPRNRLFSKTLDPLGNDGFRVIARKDDRVRLYSRPGNHLTYRFPLIVEALARLRSRSASSMARRCAATRTACRASTGCADASVALDDYRYHCHDEADPSQTRPDADTLFSPQVRSQARPQARA
jgi:hypothetical protein